MSPAVLDRSTHIAREYERDELGMVKKQDALTRISAALQTREVNAEALEVEFIISNNSIDDYGTRFDPDGCDLTQFRRNPVISYRHMRDGGIYTLPIGRGLVGATFNGKKDPDTFHKDAQGNLRMTVRFTPEETFAFGYQVYKLVRDGYLNMGSIGANSIRDEIKTEPDGTRTIVFREWELFEFSVVPLGSNNDALVTQRCSALKIDREALLLREKEISDELDGGKITDDTLVAVADDLRGKKRDEENGDQKVDDQMEHAVDAECYTTPKGHYVNIKIKREKDGIITETVHRDVAFIAAGETAEQVKYREYFEQNKDLIGEYRVLMDKMYKRLGFKQSSNERQAVVSLTTLLSSALKAPTSRARQTKPVTQAEVRTFCTKLVPTVVANVREALLQGAPVRDVDMLVEEELNKAFSTSSPL